MRETEKGAHAVAESYEAVEVDALNEIVWKT